MSSYINTPVSNFIVYVKHDNKTTSRFILHEPDFQAIPVLRFVLRDKHNSEEGIDLYSLILKYAMNTSYYNFTRILSFDVGTSFNTILNHLYNSARTHQVSSDDTSADIYCHSYYSFLTEKEPTLIKVDLNNRKKPYLVYIKEQYDILFFIVDILSVDLTFFYPTIIQMLSFMTYYMKKNNIIYSYKYTYNDILTFKLKGYYAMAAIAQYKMNMLCNNVVHLQQPIGQSALMNKYLHNYTLISGNNLFTVHSSLFELRDVTNTCIQVSIEQNILESIIEDINNPQFLESRKRTHGDIGKQYWALLGLNNHFSTILTTPLFIYIKRAINEYAIEIVNECYNNIKHADDLMYYHIFNKLTQYSTHTQIRNYICECVSIKDVVLACINCYLNNFLNRQIISIHSIEVIELTYQRLVLAFKDLNRLFFSAIFDVLLTKKIGSKTIYKSSCVW